jgi:hypothetical protein
MHGRLRPAQPYGCTMKNITGPKPETAPQFLRPNFDRMPDELKRQPNWVLWVAIWNGSKWTKRPIQISGFGASTKNPKHWSSFEAVRRAYELAVERGYVELHQKDAPRECIPLGGVGFVFDNKPDKDGLVLAGIDFDQAVCPKTGITSFARERVRRIGSYCEASVSGTGLHVIVKAHPLPSGITHNGVELYTDGRFFTMTGRAGSKPLPIKAAPAAFAALGEELRGQSGKCPRENIGSSDNLLSGDTGLDIDDFESAARHLAALTPSPFRDYHAWRDFMFACTHAELTTPEQANRVRQLFAETSAQAGGSTANNDELYDSALRATAEKLARGEAVITARTIASKARTHDWDNRSAGIPHSEQIYYIPGNETACREALDRVAAADPATFTLGDTLVILRVPDRQASEFERWGSDLPGTSRALPADVIERAEKLSWMTPVGGKGDRRYKRTKPPRDFCTDYITQRRGRYGARPLVSISRVPFMRDDGSIENRIGYDANTGTFHDRAPNLIIRQSPSPENAKAAARHLLTPFEHYRFEDPTAGPSLVLAALFTALERPFMATAPMFVIKGAQAGTGKGELARAIGRLALDAVPPFMAWGHDDDEFKKRFDAMLMASPAMLVIDNANGRMLRGDTLEMILSEGTATIRVLGRSEAVTVRNRTFLMANGNNIAISGDMTRRTFVISILPRSASPELETFPFTPDGYVIEHRDVLLNYAYTVMRAYRLAGMPRSGLPAVGSFPEWQRKVRDLIFWLTGYDLTREFDRNKQQDPHRQNDAALLAALHARFGTDWFKASEVEAALKAACDRRRDGITPTTPVFTAAPTPAEQVARRTDEDAILEAAEQVFGSKPVNAKTLGHWAKGIENAFIEDFVLSRRVDPHSKSSRLKVERR